MTIYSDFPFIEKTASSFSKPSSEDFRHHPLPSEGKAKAFSISQDEIDAAKAIFFTNGGTVKHLDSSGVCYAKLKEYVSEQIDDNDLITSLINN